MGGFEWAEGIRVIVVLVKVFCGFEGPGLGMRMRSFNVVGEKHREGGFKPFFFQDLISGGILGSFEFFEEIIIFPRILFFHLQRRLDHFIVVTVDILQ